MNKSKCEIKYKKNGLSDSTIIGKKKDSDIKAMIKMVNLLTKPLNKQRRCFIPLVPLALYTSSP